MVKLNKEATLKAISIVKAARELLAKKGGWTAGSEARDSNGYPVTPGSSRAVCYCSVGAVRRATRDVLGRMAPLEHVALEPVEAWDSPRSPAKIAGSALALEATQAGKRAGESGWYFSSPVPVIRYNDNSNDKRRVISMFDRAIKNLEGKLQNDVA